MSNTFFWVCETVCIFAVFIGFVVNAFITLSNFKEWSEGRKLKPCDKIVASLGSTRFFLQFFVLLDVIDHVIMLKVNMFPVKYIFRTAYIFLDFSNVWLATWLCVLYYIKINIFKNSTLFRFKLRLPQTIPYFILISALISFLSGLLCAWHNKENISLFHLGENVAVNTTSQEYLFLTIPGFILGHFVPYITMTFASVLLIYNIYNHVKHIRSNITSFTTPSMDAHFSAVRSVFLLYLISTLNVIAAILKWFVPCSSVGNILSYMILTWYPTLHSICIIVGNNTLKKSFLNMITCVKKYCVFKCGPRGNHLDFQEEAVAQNN